LARVAVPCFLLVAESRGLLSAMVQCFPCVHADAWSTFSASVAKLKASAKGAKLVGRRNSFSPHLKAIKEELRAEKQQRPTDEHPAGTVVDEVSLEENNIHEDNVSSGPELLNTVAALKEKLCSAHAQRTQLLEELEAQSQRIQELEARDTESPDHPDHHHIIHLEEQIVIYKNRISMLEATEDAPGSAQRVVELEQELLRMKEQHAHVGKLEAMSAAETASHADQIAELEATAHGHAQRTAQLEAVVAEIRQAEESYIRRIKELEEAVNQGPHGGQAAQRCLKLEELATSHAHRSAELEALVENLRRGEEANLARIQQLQEEAVGHSNSNAQEMEAMLGTYEKRIIELEAENHAVKSAAAEQEEQFNRQIAEVLGERNAEMEEQLAEMNVAKMNHVAQMEQDQHVAKQHELQQTCIEVQRAAELEATIANMASAEQAHRDKISKLEDRMAAQQSSHGAQLADLEVTHQTRFGELEAHGSEMRQRHQEALLQISQLEDDLASRTGQHAGHVAQLEEKTRLHSAQAAEMEARIAEMQEAHASVVSQLQAEVAANQGHRGQLESDMEGHRADADRLRAELADMEGHRVQVQRLQEELAAAQGGHRAQVQRLEAEVAALQATAGASAGSAERSESQPPFPLTPKDTPTGTASIMPVLTPKESKTPVSSMQAFEPTTWQAPTKVVQHLQPPGGPASTRNTGNVRKPEMMSHRRVPSGSRSALAIEVQAGSEARGPHTPTNYSTSPTAANYAAMQTEVVPQQTRFVPGAPPQVNLTKPVKMGIQQPLDRTRIRGGAPLSGPPSLVPVAGMAPVATASAARMPPQLHPQAQQAQRLPRRSGHWQQ